MHNNNNRHIFFFRGATFALAALFLSLLLAGACSTTRRLGEDQVLYTGIKKIQINPTGDEKLPDELVSELKQAVNVKPNNALPFITPYIRYPFPYGLWVYNYWSDSLKGVLGWIYRTLVEQPVLISDVRAPMRTKMVVNNLTDNGYFGSTATFEEIPNPKKPKKASMSYTFDISSPYRIDTIEYFNKPMNGVKTFIDSIADRSA